MTIYEFEQRSGVNYCMYCKFQKEMTRQVLNLRWSILDIKIKRRKKTTNFKFEFQGKIKCHSLFGFCLFRKIEQFCVLSMN